MENPIKMDDLGGFLTPYFWLVQHPVRGSSSSASVFSLATISHLEIKGWKSTVQFTAGHGWLEYFFVFFWGVFKGLFSGGFYLLLVSGSVQFSGVYCHTRADAPPGSDNDNRRVFASTTKTNGVNNDSGSRNTKQSS